jgi:type VI secretion system secreted protein VgrG
MSLLELQVASSAPLDVQSFEVREAISELFLVRVVALSHDPSLDLDRIVGHPASFHLDAGRANASPRERSFRGLCRSAEQLRVEPRGLSTYRFTLCPALFQLSQRRDHRIFLHRSALAIAEAVLDGWKLPHASLAVPDDYPPLPYKVQYGESDLDFFSRILEEAGLCYLFPDGEQNGSFLTLADHLERGEARPSALPHEPSPNESAERDFITDLRFDGALRPGAFTLVDDDFRRPGRPLLGEAEKAPPPEERLSQTHYRPGASLIDTLSSGKTPVADADGAMRHDDAFAKARAERGLQGEREGRRALRYRTNALDLWPGRVFTVEGFPHPELGDTTRLLATELSLRGAVGEAWTFEGRAVLAETPYHPPRRAPRPRARLQSATVVVGGNDISTDEFGRAKVRFPWDRGEGSTVWLRVSQAWAGAGYGMMTLPREGQEVLVDFLEGDPEQPVIVGRVFNRTNPVIEPLPENKTKSAWKSSSSPVPGGYNELLFEDEKGEELIHARAERDERRWVKRDETSTVVSNRRADVTANMLETIGRDRTQVTRRDRVELDHGEHTTGTEGTRRDKVLAEAVTRVRWEQRLTVKKDHHRVVAGTRRELDDQDIHLTIEKNRLEAVDGTDSLTVGGDLGESVGSYVVDASGKDGTIHLVAGSSIVLEAGADGTLKGGGGFLVVDGGGVTLVGSLVNINEGGGPGSLGGPSPELPQQPRVAGVNEPKAPELPPPPEARTAVYELSVVDELEAPIAGLRFVISTAGGTLTQATDASGTLRIEGAAPNVASAWVDEPAQIATLLEGKERGARRTSPLPSGQPWHLRTPTDLGQTIVLPQGEPQKLMILTRTDLAHHAAVSPWARHALAEAAPVTLERGSPIVLQMRSDATSAQAVVVGKGEAPAPRDEEKPEWLRATVDSLHDALFKGAFDRVFAILESIPLDPPRADTPAPEPVAEQKAFEEALAELAQQGIVDPKDPEDGGQV